MTSGSTIDTGAPAPSRSWRLFVNSDDVSLCRRARGSAPPDRFNSALGDPAPPTPAVPAPVPEPPAVPVPVPVVEPAAPELEPAAPVPAGPPVELDSWPVQATRNPTRSPSAASKAVFRVAIATVDIDAAPPRARQAFK